MNTLLRDGLGDVALELVTAGFLALWEGRAARPEELLPRAGRWAPQAAAELAKRGRAELDEQGRMVGVHGLTLRETRHRFVHAGRLHRTWCAFDAVGIPAALALDAETGTTCPACQGHLEVPVRGGEPEPSAVALWLPSPTVRHLMADFCAAADLYCGRDHLQRRIDTARHPGQVLDLPGAAALGRATWADVAGAARTRDRAGRTGPDQR